MGNACKGQGGVDDTRRKPSSQRKSSSSTSNFSPTEDPDYVGDNTANNNTISSTAAGGAVTGGDRNSRDSDPGANGTTGNGHEQASASEVNVEVQGSGTLANSRGSSHSPQRQVDPPLNRSRRGSTEREGGADSGGERSEKSDSRAERRHRESRGKDGDRRSRRSDRDRDRDRHKSSRSSARDGSRPRERGSSGGGGGGGSRRRDSERGSQGDPSGRRPRSERTEKEIAEKKERRERERAARANGDPEAEEARRDRKERKEKRERRKRKEAEAAAAAAAAAATAAGADGAAVEGAAAVQGGTVTAPAGSADFQGSSESRRERKGSRAKDGSGEARKSSSREAGGSRERGSGGASGVMAGSGGSAAGGSSAVAGSMAAGEHQADRKGKRGSSFRKMYDSLTGGFSGSAAQNSAGGTAGGGSGGGGGCGGGGPAGGGGGGGGGTSSGRGTGRPSRTSARNQVVTSVTSRDVREKYEIERSQLGHGHYGVVRRCWDKETREGYAIKTIKKSKVSRIESLRREIEILRCVDHPCIIKLYDVYEDDRFIHLVTELCTGGELFDRIIQKTESEEGHYSEKDAKVVVASILSGIEYCHNEHNICHRDLKPENFLFKRPDSDTEIKIIDFGLSRFEDMQTAMTTRVGTPYYIAPEVLSRKYDKACDLWSIGVITYILLAGYPPFYGESDQEIFASVRHGYFDFPSPEWDAISPEAKDFITQLLQKDPSARMTATQSTNHRWFDTPPLPDTITPGEEVEEDKRDKINMHVSMQRINHRLRRFVGMSKLKKVALNVIAQQLTEAEIGHLRGVFERLDSEGNGVISVNELEQVVQQEGLGNLQDDVVRLLQGIDIDGSNSLNYREFLAATMERNIFIREENIRCAFDYFDLDGKSEITLSNLVKIFGAEEHAREIMGDVNLSGEGVINYDEFKSMMMDMPLDGRDPMTPRTPRTPRFTVRA